ncbi:SHOCT domain-containing protein, partial [Streptomyces sp. NPDC127091]|uniref:SHOCT domain-containing protein n=1 Tax=Streptomyces sp. NPDC127091 TaxID=3347134 RepID=UPI003653F26D
GGGARGGGGGGGGGGARRGGGGPGGRGRGGRPPPADIADRIRHLGELHQAGLVTDEEFSSKKAELLAEL